MRKRIIAISFIVLFSIVLWGSVSLSGDFITTIKVPVKLIDLPKNYSPGFISQKEIYLRVKSKGWELAKFELGKEEEFVVSAHRRIGKQKIDLRDEIQNNNWLTSTVQVLEMIPSQLEFNVDKVIRKTVAVVGNYKLEFKPGFDASSDISLQPNHIVIYGPASILQNVDTVKTELKELLNISEPVNEELTLEQLEGVSTAENKFQLKFDVQKIVDKSFDDLLVEIRNVPTSKELVLYPSRISVVLKGGINKLGRLTNDSIKAYVDYWTVMRENDESIEPIIEIPFFTKIVDIKPKQLEYVIKQY